MPAPKKPADRRQRRNSRDIGEVVPITGKIQTPKCPPVLAPLKLSWEAFWSSTMAQVIDQTTDLPVIERLWGLYDERLRSYRAYKKARLVVGSQGQMVLNPHGRQMLAYDAEIRQLEDRIGLSPMARLRLGITYGDAQKTLESLNAAAADQAEEYDYDEPGIIDLGEAQA